MELTYVRERSVASAASGWAVICAVPVFFYYFRVSDGLFSVVDIVAFTFASVFAIFCMSYSAVPRIFYRYVQKPQGVEVRSYLTSFLVISLLALVPMFTQIALSNREKSPVTFTIFLCLSLLTLATVLVYIAIILRLESNGCSSVYVCNEGIFLKYADIAIYWDDVTDYRKSPNKGYRVYYRNGSQSQFLNHITCGKLNIGKILESRVGVGP
jgi:hypothetical protein